MRHNLQGFNSTTVQLILLLTVLPLRALLFQFHNGTINTRPIGFLVCNLIGFNSTTVQLIQREPTEKKPCYFWFQFHNGTINTLTNTQKKQLKMSELANNKYAFYMINYVDG